MNTELLALNEGVMRYAVRMERVGSRVTCSPPPTDTDIDIIVLCDSVENVAEFLRAAGFDFDGSLPIDESFADSAVRFESFSNGEVNYIVTKSQEFYKRFLAATSVAKRLNLLEKADRIALFQAVLYGNACA